MYFFQVKRLVLVQTNKQRMVGFGVNAVKHVFPQRKFVTEKMIVVALYMVSWYLDFLLIMRKIVKIMPVIQHLMKGKKTEMPVLQNVLRVKFSADMKKEPHCL